MNGVVRGEGRRGREGMMINGEKRQIRGGGGRMVRGKRRRKNERRKNSN